jgi:hypothetical protein
MYRLSTGFLKAVKLCDAGTVIHGIMNLSKLVESLNKE